MKDSEQRKAAKAFVEYWKEHSKKEKQDDQTFWNMFLRDILGVEHPEKIIEYQKETDSDKTQWIDAYVKGTHVIIEQKSSGIDLLEPTRQSDGNSRNAFEQAKNYDNNMNKSNKADWIITCNFDKFLIYNMNDIKKEFVEIGLEELPSCYDNFNILIDKNAVVNDLEVTISKEAGKIIGNIYNEIEKLLISQDSLNLQNQKFLNEFCVRLVFCCFAEDSGLFKRKQFRNYIEKADMNHLQSDLLDLFEVLNTEERRPFLRNDLNEFPYVNGELFADKIDIPPLNETVRKLILEDACDGFDWSKINPTIFGSIFESTLNPETRRQGGMHYTSIENIHKVIDPLFLNDLKVEFSDIRKSSQINLKITKLDALQDKISKLKFLDPACGSGNFLTETYLELRRLENNIIREKINLNKGQRSLFSSNVNDLIRVHIQQFYGIEINDFAVAVSKTALWIAEYQMYLETLDLYTFENDDFLPLDPYDNIIEGNALRIDWNEIIPNTNCDYIMGNPPFIGYSLQTKSQKEDIINIYKDKNGKTINTAGVNDYVSGWYYKASEYIYNTTIKVAFVSTNSITQGEQVTSVLKPLYELFNIHIDFAYRTFIWDSEANIKAHVYCVIIGFSSCDSKTDKMLFGPNLSIVKNISPYLINTDTIFIESRRNAICDVTEMVYGSKPTDGGFLLIEKEEKEKIIKKEPNIASVIKRIYGATEYINNKERYCLWLDKVAPSFIKSSPFIMDRVRKVQDFRLNSPKEATRKSAGTPYLFQEIRQPDSNYILIPCHSGESRDYIPIGFVSPNIIASNAVQIIKDATLYEFGILTSNVHMAWMRVVAGRLGMSYRYSKEVVYNNFPWPSPTNSQKEKIEKTAKLILDARSKYPDSSLADLYDKLTMPTDLRNAHLLNDRAVMEAYGFNGNTTEIEIVTKLMKMYQDLIKSIKGGKNES